MWEPCIGISPTRHALWEALSAERFQELVDEARAAAVDPDARAGLWSMTQLQARQAVNEGYKSGALLGYVRRRLRSLDRKQTGSLVVPLVADTHVPSQRRPYILRRHGLPLAPGKERRRTGSRLGGACAHHPRDAAGQQHSRC